MAKPAAPGLVLLSATALALLWANSPWGASYATVWEHRFAFGAFDTSARFVVDDGLMTLFFFVAGLEIRRELRDGVLSNTRRAVVPVAAALGGMIVPALVYFALNGKGAARAGWGIPVATDIAFAVSVLALLGTRVPNALRVLLLALAIIDDLGAIVVIAVFYSAKLSIVGAGIALGGIALVLLMRRVGVRSPLAYVVPGVVVWYGALRLGVHPTIAGVVLGLLTPVATVGTAIEEALEPWVVYGIMPTFALANAGVAIRASTLQLDGAGLVALGIVLGLVIGKPVGIVLAALLVTKLRLATLPKELRLAHVVVLGIVGGIGFTMSIFIAGLAFPGTAMLETAKLAVLAASVLAGVFAWLAGRTLLRERPE